MYANIRDKNKNNFSFKTPSVTVTLQVQRKNKQCPRQEESQLDVTILVWPTLVKSKAELGDRRCL